jgi:adenylosuccinate lyase
MKEFRLKAIGPVDGRYGNITEDLSAYFSEYALIQYRVLVEIEYFIELCEYPLDELEDFDKSKYEKLRKIYLDFSVKDALKIKEIEKTTNHDVKAVEYYIREKFKEFKLEKYVEFVHFGLTSQDINNTALPLCIASCLRGTLDPELTNIIELLKTKAREWKEVPMLSRTHGQPASPTFLGKEVMVFVERLEGQLELLQEIPIQGKFGGATGNFNAHIAAYPEISWSAFANAFLKRLGLDRQYYTTQIEHYDNLAALFDNLKRINTILLDLCKDFWFYISLDYFKQEIKPGEVGSSTMPHKINPIDFENAEGNLGYANAIFEHLSMKLPVSRLQRDLTDSTVSRNIGIPFAHTLIALKSIHKGFSKLLLNQQLIDEDLEANWVVVSEAIQTILRRYGYPEPYEALKAFTRKHEKISRTTFQKFIDKLDVDEKVKKKLKKLSPFNYTGKFKPY